ncbi:MAG TPA: ATP-binding protein, partial [Candidatus Kapabacteria bacterium]|nr:ATP-binding protein [Candidatus Kapabacteria bacterium]
TIIGKQPDIPQIDDVEARNRFNYVFQRFIKAIATEKHPIVMFIDDLQWSDHASFNLLNLLMTDLQNQFILFIGAYRNNEVFPTHPLMVITEELRHQDVSLSTIEVGNLSESNIQDLLKDTLRGANPVQNQDVNNLAALIYRKTDGNAFFTVQFLEKLYKEGFLIFDPVQSTWKWDIKEINRLAITENVVDLLLQRIKLFPQSVQDVLKLSACAGNTFALETLSVIAGKDAQIHESLEIALRENLIYPLDDRQYKFMHDRIQQAAYALISEGDKKSVHLKIGRLLLREFGEHESIEYLEKMGQRIFDIANHFNIGIEFVTAEEEKIKIARLNLKAAQKAKAAIAYGPAWEYVQQALRLLPDNSWKQNYDLTIAVYNEAIHIAFLVGNYTEIKHLSDIVLNFSAKVMDKSTVYEYQILLLITQNEFAKAVDTSSKILCSLGIDIPEKLCEKDMEIFTKTKALLEQIGIEGLKNLPPLKDEKKQLAMRVYLRTAAAISLAAQDLYPFMINKMLLLSLEFGETPETPYLLTEYAMMNACMGNIADAYKYSTLSMTLLSKLKGFDAMEVRLLTLNYAYIFHWKDPLKELSIGYWEIHQRAIQAGDSEYAAYALMVYFLYLRYTDENLAVVVRKGKNVLEIINQLKQPYQKGLAEIWFQVIENLSGNKQNPTKLPDLDSLPPTLTDDSRRMQYFYITASQLFLNCFFENREIIDCTDIVQKSPILSTCYEYPNYVFYSAILKLQVIKEAALTEKQKMFDEVKECQEKLKEWADFGPDNFLHRYYLLKAELANVNGHMYEAAEFYDKAIETANKNEFLCDEALSNELAAKFYLQNQRESLAVCYFRKAYQCYRQWGAIAKVKHLEENYPKYLSMGFPGTKLTVTGTISSASTDTTDEFLDVKSIIHASQTLSGEVQLAPLLEKMMHILIKNAGAQKSMLIENIDHCLLIQAEGTADGVSGILGAQPVEESGNLPLTVINYVARSEKTVVFDNISKDPNYSSDPYIKKYQPKSVGCFPIIRKEKLSAIIYLENNLVEGAFTPERIKILNTLAAQIAISLENAGIYRELEDLNKRLEQKVEDRTKEIAEKNLVLEQQSQQLKELDTLKSRFFANISHEFRTPLTLILGPLEQMLTVPQEKEGEQKRKMRLMLRNSQRLLGLINQLLDLSKFDSGSMKLQACRQNVVPFLKGILNSFDSLAEQNDQILTFHAAADEIILYFDPPRLEELMANLLSNAVKFTPAGGQITITVGITNDGTAGESLEISVRDTGPGIPEDQLPHIFDRFYQADSTHEHHHKGSGIGLSIAKEIVELHHGTISAHIIQEKEENGDQPGEPGGAEFVVRLPMGDAHLEPGEIVEKSTVAWKQPDETPGATGTPQANSIRRKIRDLYMPGVVDTGEYPKTIPDAEQITAGAGADKEIILVVEDSADMRLYI